MLFWLCFIAIVVILCNFLNNISLKSGVPVLLVFLFLGMLVGISDLPVNLNSRPLAERICTIALIYIMFYGGYGTKWKTAKVVVVEAGLLASVGVILTAALTGVLCHLVLRWGWLESLLLGSVVSSTDAASVFYILRAKKMGLKNNTAPILEVESGSNDPCAYLMTMVMLLIMSGKASVGNVALMFGKQIVFGAGFGVLIAEAALYTLKHAKFKTSGFDTMFMLAVATLSYAVPQAAGGNGYLSSYIVGIILGNSAFKSKKNMVSFFDGVTGLMQILVFFVLGLLVRPAMLVKVILPSLVIFIILVGFVRPAVVTAILAPFKKYSFKQMSLISFSGLRGASSIVFAITAVIGVAQPEHDILNVVFCLVFMSITVQGMLLPLWAKWTDMIDKNADVMSTFTDFTADVDMHFTEVTINDRSLWKDKMLKELKLPTDMRVCLIIHKDGTKEVPHGSSLVSVDDRLILLSRVTKANYELDLQQLVVNEKWAGKTVMEYGDTNIGQHILLIKRGEQAIMPSNRVVLEKGDLMFIH